EPDAALREFHRVLKPGGWVALVWNERDEGDPVTAEYGAVIRTAPDAAHYEIVRQRAGGVLSAHPRFHGYEKLTFPQEQSVDAEGLHGRAFSASYAPKDEAGRAAWTEALAELFRRRQQAGRVLLRYVTTLHLAKRRLELVST